MPTRVLVRLSLRAAPEAHPHLVLSQSHFPEFLAISHFRHCDESSIPVRIREGSHSRVWYPESVRFYSKSVRFLVGFSPRADSKLSPARDLHASSARGRECAIERNCRPQLRSEEVGRSGRKDALLLGHDVWCMLELRVAE